MAKKDIKEEVREEITQIDGKSIDELETLADFYHTKYWEVIRRLIKGSIYQAIIAIQKIPAGDPTLNVKKARYDGMIEALRDIDAEVRSANDKLNKAIEKEK